MSEWVSVEQELPDGWKDVRVKATNVLTLGMNPRPDGEYDGFYDPEEFQWNCYLKDSSHSFMDMCECNVTEWMHLPKLPF